MVTFSIKNYFFWTPFSVVETENNIFAYDKSDDWKIPALEYIEKRNQRRLNKLSRLVLYSAIKCTTPEKRNYVTVLSSRNGEINNALRILQDISNDELVSPQMFVNSVYNMPFAYYSIFFGNNLPSSAIASSESSLGYGFLEAVLNLKRFPGHDVLLTCADYPLENELGVLNDKSCLPYSFSVIISNDSYGDNRISFDYEMLKDGNRRNDVPDAVKFYYGFLKQDKEIFISETSDSRFTWKKHLF